MDDRQRYRRTGSTRFGALAIDELDDSIDVHRQTDGPSRCGTEIRQSIGGLVEIALRGSNSAAFGGGTSDNNLAELPLHTMRHGEDLDRGDHGSPTLASELEPEGVKVTEGSTKDDGCGPVSQPFAHRLDVSHYKNIYGTYDASRLARGRPVAPIRLHAMSEGVGGTAYVNLTFGQLQRPRNYEECVRSRRLFDHR